MEQAQQIQNCINLAAQITRALQQNKDDISTCVGPRVTAAYDPVADGAIEMIRAVQRNLVLLQQTLT